MATTSSSSTTEAQLKQKLILSVDGTVNEVLRQRYPGWKASPEFVLALTDALVGYMANSLQPDLLAFANHARRKTVTMEDVLLVARRNPKLLSHLQPLVDDKTSKKAEAAKRRLKLDTEDAATSSSSKKRKSTATSTPPVGSFFESGRSMLDSRAVRTKIEISDDEGNETEERTRDFLPEDDDDDVVDDEEDAHEDDFFAD